MPNEQKDDQASKLQQLFEEVNNQQLEEKKVITEAELIEVDVLNLPPRSEIHQKTALRFNLDLQRPFWRFVLVLIVLISIISVIYYYLGEQIVLFFT